jgi:DNA-binding transcriptional LysR family regulator
MTMTDLNALVMFAKVVEAQSFSEAARRLNLPPANVSRRVADLEAKLGIKLLERSTRALHLTDIGREVLVQARRCVELHESINKVTANHQGSISGVLRLSAPPNLTDCLIAPLVRAFQETYPKVTVQTLITERFVDHIGDGVDVAFRFGELKDSSLVARRILKYRHLLVASPEYLQRAGSPRSPQDLLKHRLICFSYWKPQTSWTFYNKDGKAQEEVEFTPYFAINDFAGLTPKLLAGEGIGDLPPVVQPELIKTGRLVEVMPDWQFAPCDLSLVHLKNRLMRRPLRLFKELAAELAPSLFPPLPA